MPYKVKKQGDKYMVYKKDTGKRVGATAGNKEALRKYMAALHINAKEQVQATNASDIQEVSEVEFEQRLKQIFKQKYPQFVTTLGKFAADPKFRQFVKNTDTTKSDVRLTTIPVSLLKPTQNEIDVDKSLKFILQDPNASQTIAAGLSGKAVKVGAPIIVFNKKFIIDGHHRWSQLYATNKDATILAYNFTNPEIDNPLDALKLTQVAVIAAGASKLPYAVVEGRNLLKMDKPSLAEYIINTISDTAMSSFQKLARLQTKQEVADYIWTNVKSMQIKAQPVLGAPNRGAMPQADMVPGGQKNTIAQLQQGVPSMAEKELREAIRREIRNLLKK